MGTKPVNEHRLRMERRAQMEVFRLARLRKKQVLGYIATHPPWCNDHQARCALIRALYPAGERAEMLKRFPRQQSIIRQKQSRRYRKQYRGGDILEEKIRNRSDYDECGNLFLTPLTRLIEGKVVMEAIAGIRNPTTYLECQADRRHVYGVHRRAKRFMKKPVILIRTRPKTGSFEVALVFYRDNGFCHQLRIQAIRDGKDILTVDEAFDVIGGSEYRKAKIKGYIIKPLWKERAFLIGRRMKKMTKLKVIPWKFLSYKRYKYSGPWC